MMLTLRMNINEEGKIICLPSEKEKCKECPNYHHCEEYSVYIDTDKNSKGFRVVKYTEQMVKDCDECNECEGVPDCMSCSANMCIMQ